MFAILRHAKLKTYGNIGGASAHNSRTIEVKNADPELQKFNTQPIGSADVVADVKARFKALNIEPRKNAVLALEYIMTASAEAFPFLKKNQNGEIGILGDIKKWKDFEKCSLEWLQTTFGEDNVVNFTVHFDEKTPHVHAIVTPIDAKGKLNCRAFLQHREQLIAMQTSFAKKVEHLGLKRGIEGSKAEHQTVKQFYGKLTEGLVNQNNFLGNYSAEPQLTLIEPLKPNWIGDYAKKDVDTFLGLKNEQIEVIRRDRNLKISKLIKVIDELKAQVRFLETKKDLQNTREQTREKSVKKGLEI